MHCVYSFTPTLKTVARVIRTTKRPPLRTSFRLVERAKLGEDPYARYDKEFLRSQRYVQPLLPYARRVRVADLMCGCGGLSLGSLEACNVLRKRFIAALAIDCSNYCTSVYGQNIPHDLIVTARIEDHVNGKVGSRVTCAERNLRRDTGSIDLLLSGPPCQGYSDLNNHTRRSDARNLLYERVARFVELTRPTHLIIENVPTVVHGHERALEKTLSLLDRYDYSSDSDIIDLADLGVPQARKRHVLIASQTKSPNIQQALQPHLVTRHRGVMWAIGDLRDEGRGSEFTKPSAQSPENSKRIAYLHDKRIYDLPDRFRPRCHCDRKHSYKSMYGRLHPRLPAQTITSGFGSPGQGRFVHPTQRRTLTPHEAARIQFFPDSFDFSKITRRTALAEIIGNAVPMKLSFALTLHLLS